MSTQPLDARTHTAEVRRVYQRLLAEASVSGSMTRTADGAAVHVFEYGAGTPAVFIHGSGSPGPFWFPLLKKLAGVRAIVVDRPGFGLSDPVEPGHTPQETAVRWIEGLLDALELPTANLVGHSMGGNWSLRFALARPERVTGLTMLGTPALPGTQAPLPYRLMGTPAVRSLIARQQETPESVRKFAGMVGEKDTIGAHPDLVELLVAVGNDPLAIRALHQEIHPLISPWALMSRTGFRRRARITESDLRNLGVPTLLVWGNHDPVGGGDVARRIQCLIPHAELEVVHGGHAPWLGRADQVATVLSEWSHRVQS